ncbi:hypothetical protein V8E51_002677 [Hyaloscypha variabilis]
MDDYLFKLHVERCRHVFEETRYLEIYAYSDSRYDTVEEHPLPLDQFDDFISQKGRFAPPSLPELVSRRAGLRMILQQHATHLGAFSPSVITLPPGKYSRMMADFHLPYKGIEGSSTVGPVFWTSYDKPNNMPFLPEIVYRKADEMEKGRPRDCVKHLKASLDQISHPMLFPVIIISHYHSAKIELRQRDARERLRKIERALTHHRTAPRFHSSYKDEQGLINFDQIILELTECHTQVLKKRPYAYLRVLDGFDEAMSMFEKENSERGEIVTEQQRDTHLRLSSRIDFYRKKLHGQEYYQSVTLERLEVQRSALSMCCGLIDNRVTFQIASAQTKLAHSSKREAVSQKVIAILGTVFLPGAYLSSLFSTTFFNWQAQSSSPSGPSISPLFWIYWAISIPLTVGVVGSYALWDWKLSKKAAKEDEAIELRMLDMKRSSQNQVIRIATGVTLDRFD